MFLFFDAEKPSGALVVWDKTTGEPVDLADYPSVIIYYQRYCGGRPVGAKTSVNRTDLETIGDVWQAGGVVHDSEGVHRVDLPQAATLRGTDGVTRILLTISGDDTIVALSPSHDLIESAASLTTILRENGATVSQNSNLNTSPAKNAVRGTTWAISFVLDRELDESATFLYFTVRNSAKALDSESEIQVKYNVLTEASEMTVIGADEPTSGQETLAAITVDGKNVSLYVYPEATALVRTGPHVYDFKEHQDSDDAYVLLSNRFVITPDVTRAVPIHSV